MNVEFILEMWVYHRYDESLESNWIEIFEQNFILLSTDFEYDIRSDISMELDELVPQMNLEYGFHKLVIKGNMEYDNYYDHEGVPDCRVEMTYDVLFCSKCSNFGELRYNWINVKEKH